MGARKRPPASKRADVTEDAGTTARRAALSSFRAMKFWNKNQSKETGEDKGCIGMIAY
jgi:hypothetical protein